nr:YceI family protein [Helicobacter baculiformis]
MKHLLRCWMALCALSLGLGAQEYTIDKAHSHVGFKVKHLQISHVRGNFKDYSALIDFDPASHTFKKLEATIKAMSIDTGNTKRDMHLRSDEFFKVEKFPNLHFMMEKYQKIDATHGRMYGTLSIAGVAHKVMLKTEIGGVAQQKGQNKLGFSLSSTIKRLDFNLAPEKSTHTIGDVIALNVEVEATQK